MSQDTNMFTARQAAIWQQLDELLSDLAGFELDELDHAASFLELGFDSLFLIQMSQSLKADFHVNISFRQLIEEIPTFPMLMAYLDENAEADIAPIATQEEAMASEAPEVPQMAAEPASTAPSPSGSGDSQPAQPTANYSNGVNNSVSQGFTPHGHMPTNTNAAAMPAQMPPMPPMNNQPMPQMPSGTGSATGLEAILAQQMMVMSMQLQMLQAASMPGMQMTAMPAHWPNPAAAPDQQPAPQDQAQQPHPSNAGPVSAQAQPSASPAATNESAPQAVPSQATAAQDTDGEEQLQSSKEMKPFGAIARINLGQGDELSSTQQAWLNDFISSYNGMTAKSKAYAAEHHAHHADPRVVSGFKLKTKELIYPIVAERTNGCRIWDIDGNEFVDALNGFGSNFFGYAHPKITQAVVDQLWKGVEIGPQSPVVGEVAKTICELTGMERAGFCNTGSEAVMGAMRIARTVTGRKLIVIFSGAYHGIFDEVIVRPTRRKNMPAAPGIMPSSVENVLVLDYGTEESLQIIRERAHELAAVMIEPIQSRRPEFQPREFLHEIRKITEESGTAFIFDEVITGFRMAPGGAQEFYGIQADIGTYGKVIGGGLQIGVVAGMAKWMDALDGGPWHYGDDSQPEVGVTYFAGTFVRHPASIAACKAALEILQEEGPALQQRVNGQTAYLVSELNNFFQDREVPLEVNHFSSLWRMTYTESIPYSEILFYLIRKNGVHIYDGFPCFLTMAHTDEDVEFILNAIKTSVLELQETGFLPQPASEVAQADFFATAS